MFYKFDLGVWFIKLNLELLHNNQFTIVGAKSG